MDISQKKIPQGWVEAGAFAPSPAPEIVRTFNAEFEVSSGSHSFRIGRVFRCYGSDNPSLGTSTRPTPTATQDEKDSGIVEPVKEGAD